MTFPFGETVVVRTAGTATDPYSTGSEPSWDVPPTDVSVSQVAVASGGSLDLAEGARDGVDSDYDLIFPADSTVTAQDRVIVRGLVCDVVGRPFLWSNPFTGWTPGLVVKTKIREG